MREIKITRTKQMEGGIAALSVDVDGEKKGKLPNGKEITLFVDEGAHEISVHGGVFTGKDYADKIVIPAGNYSYKLKIEMLTYKNQNFKPVLRAGDGIEKWVMRTTILMGIGLTQLLMDEKLRDILRKLPQARLKIIVEKTEWGVVLLCDGQGQIIVRQPHGQTKGKLMGLMLNALEQADFQTPEGCQKRLEQIFTDCLAFLPDYERTGEDEIRFKG